MLRTGVSIIVSALVLLACTSAAAQPDGRAATLELGFGGAIVADAWNPVRLVLRDVGPVELELAIDRGTLREGERWLRYRAEVPGGSGLSVFEDEVFVPVWRSLSWTVRSGSLIVASGSVPRTQADRRPVDLVVGEPGPDLRSVLVGGRAVDLASDRLPLRSAAYDGVGVLLVATPNARAQALVAAAVAGATVVVTPAAAREPALATLVADRGEVRVVGSGYLVDPTAWEALRATPVARVDHAALVSALAAADRLTPPSPSPVLPVLAGASAYVLAVLVLLRFGGLPGLLAAGVLALTASVAAWFPLRPGQSSLDQAIDLVVGADGVGQRWRVHERFTLPARTVVLPIGGRPLSDIEARLGPAQVVVDLARWRSVQVVERPRAVAMPLVQDDDGAWRNAGDHPLALVVARDGGAVRDVAAGAMVPAQTRDVGQLPAVAVALLDLAPDGAVVANDGARWFVALPQRAVAEVSP